MVNNVFHALKICFANEVGSVASAAGVDGRELLSLVRKDRKLNISGKYLEPGFAFGGSCLPKDTRAMATVGESEGVAAPLIASIAESNETHLDRVRERVDGVDGDTVGVAGIAFKSGTADTRNSPALRLVNQLEKDVVLYAGDVDVDDLVGSNRDYLDRTFPDIDSHLAADAEEFLERADIVVFANDGDYEDIADGVTSQPVCDPVGTVRDRADEFESYHSVSW
jgi:GDP-mannose 6-dehydrogenase